MKAPVFILATLFICQYPQNSRQTNSFTAGAHKITQQALDDAPERYAKFVLEILQQLELVHIPAEEDWPSCHWHHTNRYRLLPVDRKSFINLIPNTLKLTLAVSIYTIVSLNIATKLVK